MQATSAILRKSTGNEGCSTPCRSDREAIPRARENRRQELAFELCEGMIEICAALFNVSGRELRQPGRMSQDVARVRQIAMYVTHVTLRRTMNEVGRGFGRDRTTVLHACHVIEDLRDDEDFDCVIARTESIAKAAFRDRLEF